MKRTSQILVQNSVSFELVDKFKREIDKRIKLRVRK